jgi:hypothetical protein
MKKYLIASALNIPIIVLLVAIGVMYVKFNIGCAGRLKRAADANTVAMAAIELDAALAYMEQNSLTDDYTSIIYNTPNEDIGFWYQNLKASRAELDKISEESSQLEKSNVLMKLRETILDDTKNGAAVTIPTGISRYPFNTMLLIFAIVFLPFSIFGLQMAINAYCNPYGS